MNSYSGAGTFSGFTNFVDEEFIDGLAESQRDAVIAIKSSGKIAYINYSAAELLKQPVSVVEGIYYSHLFTLVREDDAERLDTTIQRCLDSSEIIDLHYNCALLIREKGMLQISGNAAPWRNNTGEQIGVLLTLRKASSARTLYKRLARF